MSMTNRARIAQRLVDEFEYPEIGALLVADRLAAVTGSLADQFAEWWRNGTSPDLSVQGYTFGSLTERGGMNPIAAFLTLDWLERDPQRATTSLRRGRDRIALRPQNPRKERRVALYLGNNVMMDIGTSTLRLPRSLAVAAIFPHARQ